MSLRACSSVPILLLLAGCVAGPDYAPPQTALPVQFAEGGKKDIDGIGAIEWWKAFRDRQLETLVGRGLEQNLDVQQAAERINSARANVVVAGAGGFPSLDVSASHTVSGEAGSLRMTKGATNTGTGAADLSWALDIFGYYHRSKESAIASLDAAKASLGESKRTYVKDVISSYIDARYYQERIALSQANLKSRRETYDLTVLQMNAGGASRLDVVQAEGLVQSTLSEIPGLESNLRTSVHRISTLLGLPASTLVAEMNGNARQPIYRGDLRSGVPADLVRNRPDIRKAEHDLAAAVADIGVTEAQLYPSITLSGSISPSWIKKSGSSGGGLTSWSFGPSLSLPIFYGGSLRANVEIARSDAKTQYLVWKETVLNAVEEVENGLTAVRRDARAVEARRRQVETGKESLELSTQSYRDGASSLLDVLDSQRSLADAQASLASAIQQLAVDSDDSPDAIPI